MPCHAMLCCAMYALWIVSKNVPLPFHSKRRTSTKIHPQDLILFISTFHPTSANVAGNAPVICKLCLNPHCHCLPDERADGMIYADKNATFLLLILRRTAHSQSQHLRWSDGGKTWTKSVTPMIYSDLWYFMIMFPKTAELFEQPEMFINHGPISSCGLSAALWPTSSHRPIIDRPSGASKGNHMMFIRIHIFEP